MSEECSSPMHDKGAFPFTTDVTISAAAIALPVIVAYGMWGNVDGGQKPFMMAFPWHPVLMTFAFLALMPLGRWCYATSALSGSSKEQRRNYHTLFMALSVCLAMIGYVTIFKAHWLPDEKQYFGYNFGKHEWKPAIRIAHVWIGYVTLALCISQALMGATKRYYLSHGLGKVFKFHGLLGKLIMLSGIITFLIGVQFWPWNPSLKLPLVVGCVVVAGSLFVPAAPASPEEMPVRED